MRATSNFNKAFVFIRVKLILLYLYGENFLVKITTEFCNPEANPHSTAIDCSFISYELLLFFKGEARDGNVLLKSLLCF